MKMAAASPKPNCGSSTNDPTTKPMKAATMIMPAAVIRRPVYASPCATAWALSLVASHSSRMRVTRKTS